MTGMEGVWNKVREATWYNSLQVMTRIGFYSKHDGKVLKYLKQESGMIWFIFLKVILA